MHPFTIRELTRKDIKILAQILHKPTRDEEWTKLVETLIDVAPSQLRRSTLLTLISRKSNRVPAVAPACALHKPLNGHVIRSIFNLVALEVGVRINHLVARSDNFSFVQRDILQSLRELHSMWLQPDVYSSTFLETPLPEWSFQEDKCEACMLARIGENVIILTSLRTVILSRTRTRPNTRTGKRPRRPRITRWVEEWINCHEHFKSAMLKKSDEDGQEMKQAWKAAYKDRRNHRESVCSESVGEGTSTECSKDDSFVGDEEREPAGHEGEDRYDFEHEIINHYDALVSTQYLPLLNQDDKTSHHREEPTSLPTVGEHESRKASRTDTSHGGEWEDVKSVYWHPRRGSRWSDYFGEGRPPNEKQGDHRSDSNPSSSRTGSSKPDSKVHGSSKATSVDIPEKGKRKGSEGMANDYRGVLDEKKRYSGSIYSRDGGGSDSDASHTPTTWSMMY
ncbi:hypothetical protein FQN54_001325 [Arachnomyces sp. PD_36]|nr:hypothetical protein FQN54_001325 [Arachnomyces sp. PD_36]